MEMRRRSFLAGGALMAASASGMLPSEQASHDKYNAAPAGPAGGLLDSEPLLQTPAADSMGVSFAVNGLSVGYAEVSESPDMKNARRTVCEGMPLASLDDRVQRVRIGGLEPGRKYWYRVGAARATYPVGYWMKPSEIEWSAVHSFTTPGENANAHFAVINDTHAVWDSFGKTVDKLREIGAPLTIWNGDASNCSRTLEDVVKIFLKPMSGAGYAADAPVLFNNGNHDFRGRGNLQLDRVMMPRLATERSSRDWALSRNYAVRTGEVALIGLDTGEDKPDFHPAAGGATRFEPYRLAQKAWLEDQLRRPDIASAPYIVAVCHIPLFDPDPGANPGTVLEDFAHWQKQAAELWGPALNASGAQLVLAAHMHKFRHDLPAPSRPWAQIVGGGPKYNPSNGAFSTVIEGKTENGRLVVRVHNVQENTVAAEISFRPRKV